jgi:5-hydroxyisourate hydrolase
VKDVRPTISTHVLDTGLGRPAPGIGARLERVDGAGIVTEVGEGTTDPDGRIASLLAGELVAGTYRLTFDLTERGTFFRSVSFELHVEDTRRSYHVPLLLAPFAITSYRGS